MSKRRSTEEESAHVLRAKIEAGAAEADRKRNERDAVRRAKRVEKRAADAKIQCPCCGELGWTETGDGRAWCFLCGVVREVGGGLSNTPPTNIRGEAPAADANRCGGVDWLSLSVYGAWDDLTFRRLVAKLEEAQKKAREGHEGRFLRIGDLSAEVAAGSGGKGYAWQPFRLSVAGMTVRLGAQQTSYAGGDDATPRPVVLLDVPSMCFLQAAEQGVMDVVRDFLRDLGLTVSKIGVSRVDVCVDLPGTGVAEFVERFTQGKCVRRTKKFAMHGSGYEVQTLQIAAGGNDVVCRIYDKLAETEGQDAKRDLMIKHRWGGVTPEKATRVEFQIRREALLNGHSIDTVEQLWDTLQDLCQWLCLSWLRFTEEKPVKNHTTQAMVCDSWQKVLAAFKAWAGIARRRRMKRTKLRPNVGKLLRQAEGCLTSAFASVGEIPENALMLVSKLFDAVLCRERRALDEVNRKRAEWESTTPDIQGLWRLGLSGV